MKCSPSLVVSCLFLLLAHPGAPISAQDLLVHGGTVVTSEGSFEADVLVREGVVSEIGRDLPAEEGLRSIDASGLLVLPGGIDPHVHVIRLDDYRTASMAAVAGGITTISNFHSPGPEEDLVESVRGESALIDRQAIADVILHANINDPANEISEIEALAATGQTSIKIFMSREHFDQNATDYVKTVDAAGDAGVLTMMHTEDASLLAHQVAVMEAAGRTSLRYLPESRPPLVEEVAMQRAVGIAEQTGAPVYAVHVASERATRVGQAARLRGLPFFIETRPIFIHLTQERFEGPDPGFWVGHPPLGKQSDQDALWAGLADGTIQVLASDHVPYALEDKLDSSQTITPGNHLPGMNLMQTMRPMLFSEGVLGGRITLERFVAVTATNPAKLFGLFPRKGTIAVGSDADLVLWDPEDTRTVRDEDMFSATGYSTFEGWEVTGWPVVTVRRGEIVYEDGAISGEPGSGRLIERSRWQGF